MKIIARDDHRRLIYSGMEDGYLIIREELRRWGSSWEHSIIAVTPDELHAILRESEIKK